MAAKHASLSSLRKLVLTGLNNLCLSSLACMAVRASLYAYVTACNGKKFLQAANLCFGNSSEQLFLLSQPLAS